MTEQDTLKTEEVISKDSTIEKIEQVVESHKDFFDKHNIPTRSAIFTFILSYLILIVSVAFGVPIPSAIIDTSAYALLGATALVTLGINGTKVVLEGIAKIKGN